MKALAKAQLPLATLWLALFLLFPATAQAQGIVLNELMADNQQAVVNDGASPDWIELRNPTAAAVSLSGWRLTDNPTNTTKYVFPANVTIPAGGFLVVWCDDDTSSVGVHSGFNLAATGGTVVLLNAAAAKVDQIAYGLQVADLSIGRLPSTGGWGLCVPTPAAANVAQTLADPHSLRINEWMASPASGDDWLELHNPALLPADLSGAALSDTATTPRLSVIPDLSFIAAEGFLRFWADGNAAKGADHLDFKLSAGGETISLTLKDLSQADRVTFLQQVENVSAGRLPDAGTQTVSFPKTPTPGKSNYLPLTNVWFNEILTHTDPPLEDAVELYNATDAAIDIGGWYLSNQPTQPKKYQIPSPAVIPAKGYFVIYEYQFNAQPDQAGNFTFNSAHGDKVVLSQVVAGSLTGYRAILEFPAAANSIAFGRHATSQGDRFDAMSRITFGVDSFSTVEQFRQGKGAANATPKVGPAVISEIMFHPPDVIVAGLTNDNATDEFIELHNLTAATLPLYDTAHPANTWKVADGVEFTLPTGVSLPSRGSLLLVGFDPAKDTATLQAFRTRYAVPATVQVLGPWKGKLDNAGETLELLKPDPPQEPPHPDAGFVPYIRVERLTYSDTTPWPTTADGTGQSLQRQVLDGYADEPLNWTAGTPTAGATAGSGGSQPEIDTLALVGNAFTLSFTAKAGQTYTVQYSTALAAGAWLRLKDIAASTTTRPETITDPIVANGARFYRIVTPAVP